MWSSKPSDRAGDTDTRRSTSGYVFTLNNSPVIWKSKLQPTPALSSMEAELMALSRANQEALWISRLFKELGCKLIEKITLYEDNQSCIAFVFNTKISSQSKHIGVRHAFIRDAITNGDVELKYKSTEDMIADTLTKPLPHPKFSKHSQSLMTPANV